MNLKEKILNQAQIALDSKNAFLLFAPQTEAVIDNGFKFIIRFYDSSLRDILSKTPKRPNPLTPPFDTDIHVCDLKDGASHHVLINKFMQCKGHIVISSIKKSAMQGDNLDISDFNAFEQVFESFNYEGILYYNSGSNSGCTQPHKHIQYTPIGECPILEAMIANKNLPFYYHIKKIDGQITSEKMMKVYEELLEESKKDPPHDSYNFIIIKGYAFYVPRKKSKFRCGTLLNSIAVSGNIPVWNWSDQSLKEKPLSALEEVCIPTVATIE